MKTRPIWPFFAFALLAAMLCFGCMAPGGKMSPGEVKVVKVITDTGEVLTVAGEATSGTPLGVILGGAGALIGLGIKIYSKLRQGDQSSGINAQNIEAIADHIAMDKTILKKPPKKKPSKLNPLNFVFPPKTEE